MDTNSEIQSSGPQWFVPHNIDVNNGFNVIMSPILTHRQSQHYFPIVSVAIQPLLHCSNGVLWSAHINTGGQNSTLCPQLLNGLVNNFKQNKQPNQGL